MSMVRSHLTFANVISCLALFVALGGGAYALQIPSNSVGTTQLKNGAVTNVKLATQAVTGEKVANNSLTGAQISEGTLGRVPSATRAQTAATADDASRLGGYPASAFVNGSQPIAGGDLTGIYGLPTIKDGAVGTDKFGTIPAADVVNSNPGSTSLPTNSETALPWTVAELDTDAMFNANQPTRLTAPVAGTYLVTGVAGVNASSGGGGTEGYVQLRSAGPSGGNHFATESFVLPANGEFDHTVTGIVHLNAGDYVEEWVVTGAAAATMGSFSSLSASWVGP
jgi:hypothetical protein